MSSQNDFFPNVDPRKPSKPERIQEDHEDYSEDECVSCGILYRLHNYTELVKCALNELRGEQKN